MSAKIKTILLLALLALGIPLLIIALRNGYIFTPQASGAVPQNITIANLTDQSVTISWTTPSEDNLTNLSWGTSKELGNIEVDDSDKENNTSEPRKIHSVTLKGLSPETQYFFRITSNEILYPAITETPYSIKTLSTPSNEKLEDITIYGDTRIDDEAIIFAYLPNNGSYANTIPLQTITKNKSWFINISEARDYNGDYIDPKDLNILIIAYSIENAYSKMHNINDSPITIKFTETLTEFYVKEILENQGTSTGIKPTASTITTPSPLTTEVETSPTPSPTTSNSIPLISGSTTPTPTTINLKGSSSNLPSEEEALSALVSPSVSNVTDSSMSISYVSYTKISDSMLYGEKSDNLNLSTLDDRDSGTSTPRFLHHYTLTNLSPNSQYYFKSSVENILRTFTTPSLISFPSGSTIVTGTLSNTSGECLVRSQIIRGSLTSSPITTIPVANISWTVNIAPVRTGDLGTFMVPTASDIIVNNAFCVKSDGHLMYGAAADTVQNAVTSGIKIEMSNLQ